MSKGTETVNGVVAIAGAAPTEAGNIIMWALSGEVRLEVLRETWKELGGEGEELPETPSAQVALRRAVDEQRAKRRLVRPLGKNGFAIVDEHATETDLDYRVTVRARIAEDGLLTVDGNEAEWVAISTAYNRARAVLAPEDVSSWLVKTMPKLDAVSLRGNGGVYFVPAHATDKLERIATALRSVSGHRVYRIPALRTDDAVEAILAAVEAEAEAEAKTMADELAGEELTTRRGWQTRIDRCDALEAKVSRYETLLGAKLDVFRERLTNLRADLAIAVFKATPTEATAG